MSKGLPTSQSKPFSMPAPLIRSLAPRPSRLGGGPQGSPPQQQGFVNPADAQPDLTWDQLYEVTQDDLDPEEGEEADAFGGPADMRDDAQHEAADAASSALNATSTADEPAVDFTVAVPTEPPQITVSIPPDPVVVKPSVEQLESPFGGPVPERTIIKQPTKKPAFEVVKPVRRRLDLAASESAAAAAAGPASAWGEPARALPPGGKSWGDMLTMVQATLPERATYDDVVRAASMMGYQVHLPDDYISRSLAGDQPKNPAYDYGFERREVQVARPVHGFQRAAAPGPQRPATSQTTPEPRATGWRDPPGSVTPDGLSIYSPPPPMSASSASSATAAAEKLAAAAAKGAVVRYMARRDPAAAARLANSGGDFGGAEVQPGAANKEVKSSADTLGTLVRIMSDQSRLAGELLDSMYTMGGGGSLNMSIFDVLEMPKTARERMRFTARSKLKFQEITEQFASMENFIKKFASPARSRGSGADWHRRVVSVLNDMRAKPAALISSIIKYAASSLSYEEMTRVVTAAEKITETQIRIKDIDVDLVAVGNETVVLAPFSWAGTKYEPHAYSFVPNFRTSGPDPAFLLAVNHTFRQMANLLDVHPEKAEEVAQVKRDLDGLLQRASSMTLSSGTPTTYLKRYWTGLFVHRLSNAMLRVNQRISPGADWGLIYADVARKLLANNDLIDPTVTGVSSARGGATATPVHRCDFSIEEGRQVNYADFDVLFGRYFGDAVLPGFGLSVDHDNRIRDNFMVWLDALRRARDADGEAGFFMTADGSQGQGRLSTAMTLAFWNNRLPAASLPAVGSDAFLAAGDANLRALKQFLAEFDYKKFSLNGNSSAGPPFKRRLNRYVKNQIGQAWTQDANHFETTGGRHLQGFVDAFVALTDAKPKYELLPATVVTGERGAPFVLPSKSRIVYSPARNMPQALFLGSFTYGQRFEDTETILNINLLTGGGLLSFFKRVVTMIQGRQLVALCFSDNLYVFNRLNKKVTVLWVSPDPFYDFQLCSWDGKSQESTSDQDNRLHMWRVMIRLYGDICHKLGVRGMGDLTARYLEQMVEAQNSFSSVMNTQFENRFMMASGQTDTTLNNNCTMLRVAYSLNRMVFRDNAHFVAVNTRRGGEAYPHWSDHLESMDNMAWDPPSVPSVVLAVAEANGVILKLEAVTGTQDEGCLTFMDREPFVYHHLDVLGFGGTVVTPGEQAKAHLFAVLGPDRISGSLAFNKRDTEPDDTDGEVPFETRLMGLLNTLGKGVSMLMAGGFIYPATRSLINNMLFAAISGFNKDLNDIQQEMIIVSLPSVVDEMLTSAGITGGVEAHPEGAVFGNDPRAVKLSTVQSLIGAMIHHRTLDLRKVIVALSGSEEVAENLRPLFGSAYSAPRTIEEAQAGVDPSADRHGAALLARYKLDSLAHAGIQEETGDANFVGPALHTVYRIDGGKLMQKIEPSSQRLEAAKKIAYRTLTRNKSVFNNMPIPDSVTLPSRRARDPAKPVMPASNFRPLAWGLAYTRDDVMSPEERTFGLKDWFTALYGYQSTLTVPFNFRPEDYAKLMDRTVSANMPLVPAGSGFIARPPASLVRGEHHDDRSSRPGGGGSRRRRRDAHDVDADPAPLRGLVTAEEEAEYHAHAERAEAAAGRGYDEQQRQLSEEEFLEAFLSPPRKRGRDGR